MATGLPSAETFKKCVDEMVAITKPEMEHGTSFSESLNRIIPQMMGPITEMMGGVKELHHEPGQTDEEAQAAATQRIMQLGDFMGKMWDLACKKPVVKE